MLLHRVHLTDVKKWLSSVNVELSDRVISNPGILGLPLRTLDDRASAIGAAGFKGKDPVSFDPDESASADTRV